MAVFRVSYRDRQGRTKQARKWYGEYRDESGKLVRVPLSTDREAAEALLATLRRGVERKRAGLVDPEIESARLEVGPLIERYVRDLRLGGARERHLADQARLLARIARECEWRTVADVRPDRLDAWLAGLRATHRRLLSNVRPASPRTKQTHHGAALAFGSWLKTKLRLPANPLEGSTRPKGQPTRLRRALPADALKHLLEAARTRPLQAYSVIRHGPNKGKMGVLGAATREKMERMGRRNVLLYRLAFETGLRALEIRRLRVADLSLGEAPTIRLPGSDTKNDRRASLPIRTALAGELRAWIETEGLKPSDPLMRVPNDTAALLRRDLKAAGLPYRDERGRVFDFHSLRKCLAAHLRLGGVPLNTAREVLRHSSIRLTAETYDDDESLHDVRGAIERLPEV